MAVVMSSGANTLPRDLTPRDARIPTRTLAPAALAVEQDSGEGRVMGLVDEDGLHLRRISLSFAFLVCEAET